MRSNSASEWSFGEWVIADMDASDTAYIKWEHGGGTDQADIASGIDYTTFSGYLVA